MFADPGLGIAERVERDDLRHVRFKGFRKIGPRRMQGHGEQAEFHGEIS